MKIISISGLDGSGKSTQIEMLRQHLENQGKKVFYFHAVHFSVANIYKRKAKSEKRKTDTAVTKANWLQIQLRKIALFIDLIRFKSLLQKLEKENYDYLLSDRYFYDNLINIAYLSNTEVKHQTSNVKRPDFAFYLKVDPRIIIQRDRVPEQGMEYLNKKQELLDDFAQKNNLTIINGNRAAQTIHEEILASITSDQRINTK